MKEYAKYIIISSIIGASIIVGAFIMKPEKVVVKPERTPQQDCYYEHKKLIGKEGWNNATASRLAKEKCGIK